MSGPAIRRIGDRVAVAGQLRPADMPALAAAGFVHVVNNRPDGEAPDQPAGETVRAAAEAAGLGYTAIPIDHTGFPAAKVERMRAVLDSAPGPVVAFCRSGARSTVLWALAEAQAGRPAAEILDAAEEAGVDPRLLRPHLGGAAGG